MNREQVLRRTALATALLLLAYIAWSGIAAGIEQIERSATPGQKAQTATQFAYGTFALLAAVSTFLARRWQHAAQTGFIVSVAISAGLASVAWGGTHWGTALISAGLGFVIAWVVIGLLRAGARGLSRSRGPEAP